MTEGLDGLRDRLEEYAAMGARFAKWRAVIRITDTLPSPMCVNVNAHALARYAALVPGTRYRADRGARGPHGRGSYYRTLRGSRVQCSIRFSTHSSSSVSGWKACS